MKEKFVRFFKQETVLCAALILAVVSMFFVHPDLKYLGYIDFRTLAILFCLMGVMSGFQKTGAFQWIAQALLEKVQKTWQLIIILVLLCFFSSMLVTNDVALITFVPFTLIILGMIGPEAKRQLVIPIVVLQTIAANLGSMLTPIGNPQNLYLYGRAGISLGSFVLLMLPYTLVSFFVIIIWSLAEAKKYNIPIEVAFPKGAEISGKKVHMTAYCILFALNLLTVARVIPYGLTFGITILCFLLMEKTIFFRVDYSLLLTFVGFFVFIGNMGRIPAFYHILQQIVSGNELLAGVIVSQIISNVPAALLLSGFTGNFKPLIIGVNLGGLGTLIASMASLISYKLIVREEAKIKGAYFRYFTLANLCILAILFVFAFLCRA